MFNLPTDNLYKFVAIFGLIIALFSIYYPFQRYHELYLLFIEHESEAKLFEFHRPFLETRTKYLEERMNAEDNTEKRQLIFDDFYKSQAETNKIWANSVTNLKKIRFLSEVLNIYLVGGILCLLLGITLMFVGFLCWYKNIQKPLDYQSAQTFVQWLFAIIEAMR